MERLLKANVVRDHVLPNASELNEEVLMLLIAGNDTTANALTFGLYYIANDLNVQSQLAAELKSLFPSKESPITYETLKASKYLVCHKTLTFLSRATPSS